LTPKLTIIVFKNNFSKITMMKATLIAPFKSAHGNITPEHYTRVLYGEQIIQRRPKRTKPATEAQKRAREAFAKKYAGKH
jgi:hypothetical protein